MFTTTTITSKLAQSIVLADRTESCTMHTVCWQQIAPLMLPPFPDCFMWSINFRMNSWFILELPWVNCSGTPDVLSCVDEFSGLVWREILTGNYGLTVLTCFNHEIYWGVQVKFSLKPIQWWIPGMVFLLCRLQDPEEPFALPQAPVQPAKAAAWNGHHVFQTVGIFMIFFTNHRENQPEMEFNGFYPLVNIKAIEHGHLVRWFTH